MDKVKTFEDAVNLLLKRQREGGRVILLSPEDYEMVESNIKDVYRFCYPKWVDAGIDHVLYAFASVPFVCVEE